MTSPTSQLPPILRLPGEVKNRIFEFLLPEPKTYNIRQRICGDEVKLYYDEPSEFIRRSRRRGYLSDDRYRSSTHQLHKLRFGNCNFRCCEYAFRTSRSLTSDLSGLFYATNTFEFNSIGTVVLFLSRLRPCVQRCLRSIQVSKFICLSCPQGNCTQGKKNFISRMEEVECFEDASENLSLGTLVLILDLRTCKPRDSRTFYACSMDDFLNIDAEKISVVVLYRDKVISEQANLAGFDWDRLAIDLAEWGVKLNRTEE